MWTLYVQSSKSCSKVCSNQHKLFQYDNWREGCTHEHPYNVFLNMKKVIRSTCVFLTTADHYNWMTLLFSTHTGSIATYVPVVLSDLAFLSKEHAVDWWACTLFLGWTAWGGSLEESPVSSMTHTLPSSNITSCMQWIKEQLIYSKQNT